MPRPLERSPKTLRPPSERGHSGLSVALDPTPVQEVALRSHCGGQRYAYNWGLARIKANLGQRAAEQTYDMSIDQLTPSLSWSAYSMRKDWNQVKDDVAPWWAENSKEVYSSGLANLANALTNWRNSRIKVRRGPRARFPRFKNKRSALSCRFTTGGIGVTQDRRHVKLPCLGTIRTYESTRKLSTCPTRHRPNSLSHCLLPIRTLVLFILGRDHPHGPNWHSIRHSNRGGSWNQLARGTVKRRDRHQPQAS